MPPTSYLTDTIELVKRIETGFLELAERLYKIQQQDLWKNEYDTFGDFVDAAGLNRTFASKLTMVHRAYVIEGAISSTKLLAAGYEKLYTAIPLLEENAPEFVVAKARLLTLSELRDEVRDEHHGDCMHEQTITICAHCRKKL